MTTLDVIKETAVGRFSVEVELANDADLVMLDRGLLKPEQVRRMRIRGMVDTGATRLVIPQQVSDALGLTIASTTVVRYADRRTAERSVADRLRLTYAGRSGIFSAIIEPARDVLLIGAIVLEDLDFLVDPRNQCLVPRDPNTTISEVE